MKDIDFDELDRAVSSVLAPEEGQPTEAPVAQSASNPTDSSPSTTSDVTAPSPATTAVVAPSVSSPDAPPQAPSYSPPSAPSLDTVAAPSIDPIPQQQAPVEAAAPARPAIVARKSGRFMDVVPASGPAAPAKPAAVPSRAARVLQPTGSLTTPDQSDADESEDDLTSPTAVASPVVSTPAPQSTWPDPLDVHDLKMNESTAAPADSSEAAALPQQPAATPTPPPSVPVAFITDSKVEKRPLGAFSNENNEPLDKPTDNEANSPTDAQVFATRLEIDDAEPSELDKPVTTIIAKPKPPVEKLPPELDQDIVAVEADNLQGDAQKPQAAPAAAPASVEPPAAIMSAETAVSAASAMSIPKQYTAEEQSNTPGQHPLFDTKEYHPPLVQHNGHAQGHRSTIIWVIVALLLLVATAAGFGYWLYSQI